MAENNLKSFVVGEGLGGRRLDVVLGGQPDVGTRTQAGYLIKNGEVSLNKKPGKASAVVSTGDLIEYTLPVREVSSELKPLDLSLDILYEDTELLVLNKPGGLVVHPSAGHEQDTLVNALLNHTSSLSDGFKKERPGIVHRLDRDTSGLLVVAKTNSAHAALAEQFKNKTAGRIYLAVTYGVPRSSKGTFRSKLGRDPSNRKKMATVKIDGREAITHYTVEASFQTDVALIRCRLETGRTHQIRVHLSEAGHAVVGDPIYCQPSRAHRLKNTSLRELVWGLPRLALHATELSFTHPQSGERKIFHSDWPVDLKPLIDFCGFLK